MTLDNHIPFLYKIAYRYTSHRTVADDLVQETLYKALKYKTKFRKGTNLKAWLSTILRNNFINEYRQKAKYFTSDNIVGLVGNKKTYTAPNDGESRAQLDYISNVIEDLPENLKRTFILYYEGYSYAEISEIIRAPIGTVKSRIHHARKQLRSELQHLKAA